MRERTKQEAIDPRTFFFIFFKRKGGGSKYQEIDREEFLHSEETEGRKDTRNEGRKEGKIIIF